MGLEIRAQVLDWLAGVQIVLFERNFDGKAISVGKVIMESQDPLKTIAKESRIELENSAAQSLMDDLWKCGLRPTEGTGSAGSLAATQKHLGDMRALVSKCMKVDLK